MEQTQSSTQNNDETEELIKPPSYERATATNVSVVNMAPPYAESFDLPSYDLSQKLRAQEIREEMIKIYFDTDEGDLSLEPPRSIAEFDCMFWSSFWLSLLFNWIGFFIGYCIINTVASKSGALAGLGLSLLNFLLYLRIRVVDIASDQSINFVGQRLVIWWVLLALAILIFIKGIYAGTKCRQQYRELSSRRIETY